MAQTLEQKRAQFAWECAQKSKQEMKGNYKQYADAAKGLPALIMNSGLMQVMAFAHEKSKKAREKRAKDEQPEKNDGLQYALIEEHLRNWLHGKFDAVLPADFEGFMKKLLAIDNAYLFQTVTTEALAWLKWLRQIAPALND
jgi:CRISPR-associated protein Cmr5